jgi:hypothetical protein
MSSRALRTVGTAAAERVVGDGPGRTRAFAAAVVTGVVAAAATYRLLRSNADSG